MASWEVAPTYAVRSDHFKMAKVLTTSDSLAKKEPALSIWKNISRGSEKHIEAISAHQRASGKTALSNNSNMETDTTPTTKVEREMTLSREQMQEKSMDALQLINRKILCRVRGVFKELSDALEQKDSLLWELQYRFITIEQLLKNREKLKMMQPGTPCPRAESEKGGDLGM
ncbi:hypothetical protein NDU88_006018 [Pleurodeles waltl]|uniref:Uncharacterized protein n=2 Tax=Pleurodeles waltl TaxID=8319 RepID=A0AAV7UL67_PLEWA|nr:hypothetical protein NDU88_006018 [Pleurodeles waltl]